VQRRAWGGSKLAERGELTRGRSSHGTGDHGAEIVSLPRNARSQALHAQAMTRAPALGSRGRLLRSALPPRVSTPLWRERAVRRPNADLDALFLLTCIHIPTRSPDAGKHPACSIAEPSNGSARHSIARHQAGRWHAPRRARCRPEKTAKNARIVGQHLGFRRTRPSSWNQEPVAGPLRAQDLGCEGIGRHSAA